MMQPRRFRNSPAQPNLLADSGAEVAVTLDLKLLLPKVVAALGRCALKKVVVGTMGEILRFPQRQLFAIAKRGDLASRRRVLRVVRDKGVVHSLFTEIG